jgi:ubiquinone/menaquinone biosynthesis C-methylase UbiE
MAKKWEKVYRNKKSALVSNFDRIQDVYIPKRRVMISLYNDIVKLFNIKPKSILDLGAGNGAVIFSILKEHKKAIGHLVDGSNELLNEARIKNKRYKYNLRCFCEDLKNKGWIKNKGLRKKYDLIVSNIMIHHLTRAEKLRLFKDVRRMLNKKGMFIYGDVLKMDNKKLEDFHHNFWVRDINNNKNEMGGWKIKRLQDEKKFLIDANKRQGDMPATVNYILNCFKKAGYKEYGLLWFYIKFGVFVGLKQ